jgi:hypothetical protein
MNDGDWTDLEELINGVDKVEEVKENVKTIKKIMTEEEKRKQINAKYYQKHKDEIANHNAMKILCKICNTRINKGSYQLHKKSRLHQSLLQVKLDTINDSDDE